MTGSIKNIADSAIHLFYPHICTGCGSDLLEEDNLLCLRCIHELPHTNFAFFEANPVEKYFWGRIPVVSAHSEFYFSKEFLIQHLIHLLKYRGDTRIGFYLGELMGMTMLKSSRFNTVDALIPLPLYPERERKRGYNQATIICNGISSIMNIPVLHDVIVRQRPTETQTRKHRTERWENVQESFKLVNKKGSLHRHLMLVDDVVTTGATLEACGSRLLQAGNIKLSLATLAYAAK